MIRSTLKRLFYKESQARIVASINQVGQAVSTPANYEGFSKQGYSKAAIVYACINKIAQAVGGVKWEVYSKRPGGEPVELENHPLLDLINRPNPMQATSSFFESMTAFYCLTGNTYLEAARPGPSAPPLELWTMRPDRMTIVPGKNGYPQSYCYSVGQNKRIFPVDFIKLQSDVLHIKTFNPLSDWYGMAPLEAAMLSLDQLNSASRWNLALLQNNATPSGVLQVMQSPGNPRGEITDVQYNRLQANIEERMSGPKNAKRPMILEGGLSWQQISADLVDMQFLEGKNVNASDIAQVFGVPLEILGLGQKTFQNYKEARLAFYNETVLPILDLFKGELNRWLAPAFGDVYLEYDKDDIEALSYQREQKFNTVKDATFLTQNEKRESVGYAPIEGWDVFLIGNQLLETPNDMPAPAPAVDPNAVDEVPPKDPGAVDEVPTEDPPIEDDNADSEKSFKSFNLINSNERRISWKRQNARRKRLQNNFERDLKEDLLELNSKMIKAAKGIKEPKLAEYAMTKVVGEFMPTIEKTLKRHIRYTLEDFGNMILEEGKSVFKIERKANLRYEDFTDRYIVSHTADAIKHINGTTEAQVSRVVKRLTLDAINNGDSGIDVTNDLLDEFNSLSPGRARTIARTEVALASNNATVEAVKSLQIPNMVKEWVSASDERVRDDSQNADHSAMNGVTVSLDDKFTVPPDSSMEGPGDPSAPPEQIINCRCVLTFNSRN